MATSVGKEKDKLEMLQDLIKLDHAAVEAYEEAIEHLDNASYRQELTSFMRDHQRHINELEPIVRAMGGKVPTSGGFKEWLSEGKVSFSSLRGDKAILKAMKSNENDTNTAYERVVDRAPAEALDVVTRGLHDERRHRAWILEQLGEASPESYAASRSRSEQPRPGGRPR